MRHWQYIIEMDERLRSIEREHLSNPSDESHARYTSALRQTGEHDKARALDSAHSIGKFVSAYKTMRKARAVARTRRGKPDADHHQDRLDDAEAEMWHAAENAHATPHASDNAGEHLHPKHFDNTGEHVRALAHLHGADSMHSRGPRDRGGIVTFNRGYKPEYAERNAKSFAKSVEHHYRSAGGFGHQGQRLPHQSQHRVFFATEPNTDMDSTGDYDYHEMPEKL